MGTTWEYIFTCWYRNPQLYVLSNNQANRKVDETRTSIFRSAAVPGKRDHLGNFFKIELLLQQERVDFELQNALHI